MSNPSPSLALPTTTAISTSASPPPQSPSGLQAIAAAAMAMLGVVTALYPNAPLLAALTTALPQLKLAIPIVLTAVGSVWAAVSHPPSLPKR
jgi:hypothetical protein